MKWISSFLILVFASQASASLKVFWWNILRADRQVKLEKSLKEISQQDYDLILLGEYPSDYETGFFANYPHHRRFAYSQEHPELSLQVYSKLPIGDLKVEQLSWQPETYEETWSNRVDTTYFNRPYIHFKVVKNEKTYAITPVHLLQNWSYYLRRGEDWKVGWYLFQSKKSPHYAQTADLVKRLKRDRSEINLVMGDFNFPEEKMGMQTLFDKLFRQFKEAIEDDQPTFPSQKIKIDHAYVSGAKAKGRVLKLRGSDHRPIEVVID